MVKNGSRIDKDGWTRVTIQGAPYERGFAHGALLQGELDQVMRMLDFVVMQDYGISRNNAAEILCGLYGQSFERNYPEFLEEIKGITAGARSAGSKTVTQDLVMFWNLYYTFGYVYPHIPELLPRFPELQSKYAHLFPSGSKRHTGAGLEGGGGARDRCTAFMAVGSYTRDGKIVCAHNTFDNFIDAQYGSVMLEIRPNEGTAFIMQTAPGQIASGTDYYVTDNGFIVTETTIGGFHEFRLKDPICCRIRQAVQYSKSLDDYVRYLENGNGGDYANSWLIGDTKSNEIMRIELGLQTVAVEKKKDGYFIGFNAPENAQIRCLECTNTGYFDIRRHQGARRVRLTQLMEKHKGELDIAKGQEILADHYDVYLNKINMCSRTCCSHYDLDPRYFMSEASRPKPFQPRGAMDGIVTDTTLARKHMGLTARWGNSCGTPFDAKAFCERNIQWAQQAPYLLSRPHQPWSTFVGRKSLGQRSRRKSVRRKSRGSRRRRA